MLVPNGNRNWLTVSCESVDNRSNERSLPIDLMRDGRTRPLAASIASRNPNPFDITQSTKAQIAEASDRQRDRSTAVRRALSHLPEVLDALKILKPEPVLASTARVSGRIGVGNHGRAAAGQRRWTFARSYVAARRAPRAQGAPLSGFGS